VSPFIPPFDEESHGDVMHPPVVDVHVEPHGELMPPCDKPVEINSANSSGHAPGFNEFNVFDGKPDTRWVSTTMQNPWIRFELKNQKPVCRVDITWFYSPPPNAKPYHFYIETSLDEITWTKVYPSGVTTVTSTSFEQNWFDATDAKYVKITITDSGFGSSFSLAQISEVNVYSKT
jgi:F5/8 type C domain-containing protein